MEKIGGTLNNLQKLILLNILLLILMFFFFNIYIKDFVSVYIKTKTHSDYYYYIQLINNADYAFLLIILICSFLLFFHSKIIKAIAASSVSNILLFSVLLSVVFQVIIISFVNSPQIADSVNYIEVSNNLYYNSDYSWRGHLSSYWPPGLPFILFLLKYVYLDTILLAKLLNIVISILIILTLFKLFRDYLNDNQLKAFLLIWSFFPNNLFAANIVLTDHIYLFFLWYTVWVLFKFRGKQSLKLMLVGILLGFASLFRPSTLPLPLIFGIIYVSQGLRIYFKKTLVIALFMSVVIAPWTIRNLIVFNEFIPISTNGGVNFLIGNNINSIGAFNWNFNYNLDNPNEVEEEKLAYKKALSDIANNPVKSLVRIPLKILISYSRGDNYVSWSLNKETLNASAFIIIFSRLLTNLLFYNIIFWGFVYLYKNKFFIHPANEYFFFIGLSVFFLILIMIFVGGERYILPIVPLHFLLFIKYLKV